jgi:hypothetical protein
MKLPFPPYQRKKIAVRDYTLPYDIWLEQWKIPKGTVLKLATGLNFGYVVVPANLELPKRIFRI